MSFGIKEDRNAEEAIQAGRDCCKAAAGDVLVSQGQSMADAIRQIGVSEVTYYLYGRLSRCKSILN